MDARAPEPLPDNGPKDKNWKIWRQELLTFMKASNYKQDTDNKMDSFLLMNLIGRVGQKALQSIQFDEPKDKENFEILLQKFDDYFDPPKKVIEERYNFYTRSKKNNESIDDFIASLKELAKTCNFGDLTESLIRDMVILNIKDKGLRKIMFEEQNLNLTKLGVVYKAYELHTEKMMDVTKKMAAGSISSAAGSTDKAAFVITKNKGAKKCGSSGTSHATKGSPAKYSVKGSRMY